ncbi:hypothetical protein CEXT_173171 [Caerostris extrusa]|uniref:Uncharacterized protein n=1 Tax=Caerostris extrusa TaxID=172846 RepID=A0AAV4P4V3_CAEEX|nr:hypothetical protein CEXT_173171 [Caerostris extrusa]
MESFFNFCRWEFRFSTRVERLLNAHHSINEARPCCNSSTLLSQCHQSGLICDMDSLVTAYFGLPIQHPTGKSALVDNGVDMSSSMSARHHPLR